MTEKSIEQSPQSVQKLWLLKSVGPERIEEFIIVAESAAVAMTKFTEHWMTRKDCFTEVTPIKGPMYYCRDYPAQAGVQNVSLTVEESVLIEAMLDSVVASGWLTKKERRIKRSLRRKLTEADTATKKSVAVHSLERMVRLTDEIEGRS